MLRPRPGVRGARSTSRRSSSAAPIAPPRSPSWARWIGGRVVGDEQVRVHPVADLLDVRLAEPDARGRRR